MHNYTDVWILVGISGLHFPTVIHYIYEKDEFWPRSGRDKERWMVKWWQKRWWT